MGFFQEKLAWTFGGMVLVGMLYLFVGYYIPPQSTMYFPLPMESMIPFVPSTIWLYLLGLYLPFLASIYWFKHRNIFYLCVMSIGIGATVDLLIFILMPMAAPRPLLDVYGDVIQATSYPVWHAGFDRLSPLLVSWVYQVDPMTCTFPSTHITYPVCLALALRHENKKLSKALWILIACLYLSTLTTKQHFLMDGIVGAFVGYIAHLVAFSSWMREFLRDKLPMQWMSQLNLRR